MNNKEYYQRTFSQVHSSSRIQWEDYTADTPFLRGKISRTPRRLTATVLTAVLLTLLCGTALAAGIKSIRNRLLQDEPDTFFQSMGFSGYVDSPESQALVEWLAFCESYDPEGEILYSLNGREDENLKKYQCYSVYTQEMAEELERIADKYDLKLHTDMYDIFQNPELLTPLGDFLGSNKGVVVYMYEDGSFSVDSLDEQEGIAEFQLVRTVKGSLHTALLYIDASKYQEWNYVADDGTVMILALGDMDAFAFADLGDCFVTIYFRSRSGEKLSRSDLEELAGSFQISLLTPVVTPEKPKKSTELNLPAGKCTEARTIYAAVLRNFLDGGQLPDLRKIEKISNSSSQFAVSDLFNNGREELILLYNAPEMENSMGFVVDFDEYYTGDGIPAFISLQDFPDFTFYTGGYVAVKQPRQEGTGGVLQPSYRLYRCENTAYGTRYSTIADVSIEKKTSYPDDSNKNEDQMIYYVSFNYASGVEPAGVRYWDQVQYEAWLEELDLGDIIDIPYMELTEENIRGIEDPNEVFHNTIK